MFCQVGGWVFGLFLFIFFLSVKVDPGFMIPNFVSLHAGVWWLILFFLYICHCVLSC